MATMTHAEAVRAMTDLPPGTGGEVFDVAVARDPGGALWSVAGGPALTLLPAIDAAARAGGYRTVNTAHDAEPEPEPPPPVERPAHRPPEEPKQPPAYNPARYQPRRPERRPTR